MISSQRRKKKEKKKRKIKDLEANLVHQSGNGVFESLGEGGEGMEIVSLVGIHNTLGTDSSLVSLTVGVDFLMRMLLAMKNPRGG